MADMIVLALIAGYCLFVIIQHYRKKKKGSKNGCTGACAGCSGCSDMSRLKVMYDAKKREDNLNG